MEVRERMSPGKLARILPRSLLIIAVALVTAFALIRAVWTMDPPWSVNAIRGSVLPQCPCPGTLGGRFWDADTYSQEALLSAELDRDVGDCDGQMPIFGYSPKSSPAS